MMRNGYTEPSILVENEDSLGAKRNLVAFVAGLFAIKFVLGY